MSIKELLTMALVLIYLVTSCYYTWYVAKSPLTQRTKSLNIFLVWIIPIIWGLLIKSMFKPMTEKDKKNDTSSFYESGIGENI